MTLISTFLAAGKFIYTIFQNKGGHEKELAVENLQTIAIIAVVRPQPAGPCPGNPPPMGPVSHLSAKPFLKRRRKLRASVLEPQTERFISSTTGQMVRLIAPVDKFLNVMRPFHWSSHLFCHFTDHAYDYAYLDSTCTFNRIDTLGMRWLSRFPPSFYVN